MIRPENSRRRGYTLVELLVVGVLMALVVAYVLQTLGGQQKTHVVVEQVTETQQNLRLLGDLIEREVRVAGYMVPPAAAACGQDSTSAPDVLYLSAADSIRSISALEAIDPALVRGNMGAPVTGVGVGPVSSTADLSLTLSQRFIDVGADGDDFFEGGGLILTDRNDATGAVACGRIVAPIPAGASPTITVDFEPNSMSISTSADLIAVPAHVYRIVPATGAAPSQLFRDSALVASDVEDLQIVYFFDSDDDRVVDPGEIFGDSGTATYPPPATIDYKQLIELRLRVVMTTRADDPHQDFTPMKGQPTANRTQATVPGPDRKRRRVHTSMVRLRNLG